MRRALSSVVVLLAALAVPLPPASASAPDTGPRDAASRTTVAPPDLVTGSPLGPLTIRAHESLTVSLGLVTTADGTSAGPGTVQVQVRRAAVRAAKAPAWTDWRTTDADTTYPVTIGSGRAMCFRGRQSSDGVTSAWSRDICLVRAIDDQHLTAHGRVTTRRDRHYADGRASVLHAGARWRLARVPARAWYGVVLSDELGDSSFCSYPTARIAGHRVQAVASGPTDGGVMVLLHHRDPWGGTVVVSTSDPASCRTGGVMIVPRWAR